MNIKDDIEILKSKYEIKDLSIGSQFTFFIEKMINDEKLDEIDKVNCIKYLLKFYPLNNRFIFRNYPNYRPFFNPEIIYLLKKYNINYLIGNIKITKIYPGELVLYKENYKIYDEIRSGKKNIIRIINPFDFTDRFYKTIKKYSSDKYFVFSVFITNDTINELYKLSKILSKFKPENLCIDIYIDNKTINFTYRQTIQLFELFTKFPGLNLNKINSSLINHLIKEVSTNPNVFNNFKCQKLELLLKYLYSRGKRLNYISPEVEHIYSNIYFNKMFYIDCKDNILEFLIKINKFPIILKKIANNDLKYKKLIESNFTIFRDKFMRNFQKIYKIITLNNLNTEPFYKYFDQFYNSTLHVYEYKKILKNCPELRKYFYEKYYDNLEICDFMKFMDFSFLVDYLDKNSEENIVDFIYFIKLIYKFLDLDTDEFIKTYFQLKKNYPNDHQEFYYATKQINSYFVDKLLPKIIYEIKGIDLNENF